MSTKRGMTLIELVVAITLFTVVVTLAAGGFVSISHLKTQMIDMKNTQQKARSIYETIYRASKEANRVTVDNTGNTLTLVYYDDSGTPVENKIFTISGNSSLNYCDILISTSSTQCSTEEELLAGDGVTYSLEKNANNQYFKVINGIPSTLSVYMRIKSSGRDADTPVDITNMIILESVK